MIRHDDHGMEWRRIGGRELANVDGHGLVVMPGQNGGFLWGVLNESTGETIDQGKEETRGEARRRAVWAAAKALDVPTLDEPPPAEIILLSSTPRVGRRMRAAARIVVTVTASAVVGGVLGSVLRLFPSAMLPLTIASAVVAVVAAVVSLVFAVKANRGQR